MQDAIEDSIDIDATAEQVWPLVSEPGWWINDGNYTEHVIEQRDGLALVTDPAHGVFPITTVGSEQPRYVAFRWLSRHDDPRHIDDNTSGWRSELGMARAHVHALITEANA